MDLDKIKALQIRPEARRRPQRFIWIILLGIGVLTGLGAYYAWPEKGQARRLLDRARESLSSSDTSTIAAAPVLAPNSPPHPQDAVLTASGYIVNRERIELSPRMSGLVKWIGVSKGDAVTNGQVLVLFDDAEQRARLLEAQGRLANARVTVKKAELDYSRIKKLIADKIETPQSEDDARLKLEAARATLQEFEGMVDLAKTYLDWTVIRSPITGVVLEKMADAGELVSPQSFGGTHGPSTMLVALANPKDLQVEVDLNESDLSKVFAHQKCRITPEAYPGRSYKGHVAEIAPEANRQKGTLQIKVQVEEPDRFMTPELSAKVEFLGKLPL